MTVLTIDSRTNKGIQFLICKEKPILLDSRYYFFAENILRYSAAYLCKIKLIFEDLSCKIRVLMKNIWYMQYASPKWKVWKDVKCDTKNYGFFWNSFLLKRWILKRSLTCVNKDFTKKIVKREKHKNMKMEKLR